MTYVALEGALDRRPADWKAVPFKRLAELRRTTNSDGGSTILSLTTAGELRPRDMEAGQQAADDYLLKYWRVRPDELVVNPMWLAGSAIGVSDQRGAVSPDYRVYALDSRMDPRFVHHLMRSSVLVEQYGLLMRAETTFDRRISRFDFERMPLPVPPLAEQRAIADFLDTETARIDALITKKRALVSTLRERLDAHLDAMLGSYPSVPLMHLTDDSRPIVYGIVQAGPEIPDGVPYIKTGDMASFTPEALSRTSREIDAAYQRARVRPGDMVVAMRASIGALMRIPETLAHANLTQGTARIAPSKDVDGDWLWHALRIQRVQTAMANAAVGTTFMTLNIWDLRRVAIPTPPKSKQAALAQSAAAERSHVDRLTAALEEQIDLLREHRQALITAAVTGQMDVPGVAA